MLTLMLKHTDGSRDYFYHLTEEEVFDFLDRVEIWKAWAFNADGICITSWGHGI